MFRIIITVSCLLSIVTLVLGQSSQGNDTKIILKSGTEFSAKLETPVDVTKTQVGADITLKLTADLKGVGVTIPKDSVVSGRIIEIQQASSEKEVSKVGIIFDFIQNGEDFIMFDGAITSIVGMPADLKYETQENLAGNTTLSMKGKNILIEPGKQFNIKLAKDSEAN